MYGNGSLGNKTTNVSLNENDLSTDFGVNLKISPNESHSNSCTQHSTNSVENVTELECEKQSPNKFHCSVQSLSGVEDPQLTSNDPPDLSLQINRLPSENKFNLSSSIAEPEHVNIVVNQPLESGTNSSEDNTELSANKTMPCSDSQESKDSPLSPNPLSSSSKCILQEKGNETTGMNSNTSTSDALSVINDAQTCENGSLVHENNEIREEEDALLNQSIPIGSPLDVKDDKQILKPPSSPFTLSANLDLPEVNALSYSISDKSMTVEDLAEGKEEHKPLKAISPNHNSLHLNHSETTPNTSNASISDLDEINEVQTNSKVSNTSIENKLIGEGKGLILPKSMAVENSLVGEEEQKSIDTQISSTLHENNNQTTPNELYSSITNISEEQSLLDDSTLNKSMPIENTSDERDVNSLKTLSSPNDNKLETYRTGASSNESHVYFSVSSHITDVHSSTNRKSDGFDSALERESPQVTLYRSSVSITDASRLSNLPVPNKSPNSMECALIEDEKVDAWPAPNKTSPIESKLQENEAQHLINSPPLQLERQHLSLSLKEEEDLGNKTVVNKQSVCSGVPEHGTTSFNESMSIETSITGKVENPMDISPSSNQNSDISDSYLPTSTKSNSSIEGKVIMDDVKPCHNESSLSAPIYSNLNKMFGENENSHKSDMSIPETLVAENIQQNQTEKIEGQNFTGEDNSIAKAQENIFPKNILAIEDPQKPPINSQSAISKICKVKGSSSEDYLKTPSNNIESVQNKSLDISPDNILYPEGSLDVNSRPASSNESCNVQGKSKTNCNLDPIQQSPDSQCSFPGSTIQYPSNVEMKLNIVELSPSIPINVVEEQSIASHEVANIEYTAVSSDHSNKHSTLKTDLVEDIKSINENNSNKDETHEMVVHHIVDSIEFDPQIANEAANISDEIFHLSQDLESDSDNDLTVLSVPDKNISTNLTYKNNESPMFKKPSNPIQLIKKKSPTKSRLGCDLKREDSKAENDIGFVQQHDQSMRPVLAASHLNQSEAGPITADEFTTDSFQDGATLDLDYFTSVGGTGSLKESLTRDSLYVKFDPIVGAIVSASVNERFTMPPPVSQEEIQSKATSEEEKLADPSGESTESAASVSSANTHTPVRSPALEVVQKLISLTPTAAPATSTSATTPVKVERSSPAGAPNPSPKTASATPDLHKMLKKLESDLQERDREYNNILSINKKLEVDLKVSIEREQSLKKDVQEKTKSKQQLSLVIEEYEKTISQLVAQKEEEKKGFEVQKLQLIQERDTATQHLNNMEIAFNDIHQKYERGKSIIEGMKANEDRLKESLAEYDEAIKSYNAKYEHLKTHAIRQLETANQELDMIRRNHQAEVAKLKAMLKKAEVKATSMEESLEQKTKENNELAAICDELINKVGSGNN